MMQSKRHPLRVRLGRESYDSLIKGLKINETEYSEAISYDAARLREKIERHGRREMGEDGKECFRLGFFESEGEKFIYQFAALAQLAAVHQELLDEI
jgi:hypothetical protein